MIIYPSLPSGYTIFCDDIRHETTGKVTFVGTYGTRLFIATVPSIVPRICCAVTYREATDAFGKVAIRVIHEVDEDEKVLGQIEYEISPNDLPEPDCDEPFVMREAKFFFEISPFAVPGPGLLKVRAFRDDNEIRLGSLKIEMGAQEAAGQEPD